nr:hypothetical protein Iba_chr03aCG15650 [Ipomoea batatas]
MSILEGEKRVGGRSMKSKRGEAWFSYRYGLDLLLVFGGDGHAENYLEAMAATTQIATRILMGIFPFIHSSPGPAIKRLRNGQSMRITSHLTLGPCIEPKKQLMTRAKMPLPRNRLQDAGPGASCCLSHYLKIEKFVCAQEEEYRIKLLDVGS